MEPFDAEEFARRLLDVAAEGGQPLADVLAEAGERLPFNLHTGVEVRSVEPGRAQTVLRQDHRLDNHIGTVHAIAELAPAELAGATAVGSRLGPLYAAGYLPLVRDLRVRYRKPARGELVATASFGAEEAAAIQAAVDAGERAACDVEVDVSDAEGTVAEVTLGFVFKQLA